MTHSEASPQPNLQPTYTYNTRNTRCKRTFIFVVSNFREHMFYITACIAERNCAKGSSTSFQNVTASAPPPKMKGRGEGWPWCTNNMNTLILEALGTPDEIGEQAKSFFCSTTLCVDAKSDLELFKTHCNIKTQTNYPAGDSRLKPANAGNYQHPNCLYHAG